MAIIENFPEDLLAEHERWHMSMSMRARAGDGLDFLAFHRDFLSRAMDWYRSERLDPQMLRPWSSIPVEIKNHPRWDQRLQEAENRVNRNLDSFRSADELGRFLLATNLHGAVHVLGAEVYNEPDFALIARSPRSTYFYKWHRLIDNWWRRLEEERQD
ncbi:hypothetical protein ACFYKX_05145 [Cytobacillus sp. FJAT-54145]|uniref:Uncharacterized protein n=1 Tax=Cytobacillus spartinae TaxID=3299023 RepID=A0ABW6KAR0_9BACI